MILSCINALFKHSGTTRSLLHSNDDMSPVLKAEATCISIVFAIEGLIGGGGGRVKFECTWLVIIPLERDFPYLPCTMN